jgi:hypothetical protein
MPKGVGRGVGGGRPLRDKRAPLNKSQTFRLTVDLDKKLRDAATESGRSVSEEIQFRLEQSFLDEGLAKDLLKQVADLTRRMDEFEREEAEERSLSSKRKRSK